MRLLFALTFCLILTAQQAMAFPTVPQAASAMGRELDRQMVERLQQPEPPAKGVSLFVTTPVCINDLEEANPLARQMEEELARWFVQAGYPVQEIRKGAEMYFDPATGEMLLTRNVERLGAESPNSAAVLVGTYAVTSRNVRFNIRIVQTSSLTVLAMSTITVPLNGEVASLLRDPSGKGGSSGALEPTVFTHLP
jgi:hypothetical protein